MELIINDDNLQNNEVQKRSLKVRAILVDENNKILIANYGNVILLPGGKVDAKETIYDAIIRELNEEIGQNYTKKELDYFITLNYYQKNYPKREGIFENRLVQIHYFIGKYKEIKKDVIKLTEKEQKDNLRLELVSLEELENIILNNKNDNPRNIYFQKELLAILASYKKLKQNPKVKKIKSKLNNI